IAPQSSIFVKKELKEPLKTKTNQDDILVSVVKPLNDTLFSGSYSSFPAGFRSSSQVHVNSADSVVHLCLGVGLRKP
ncbi:unnamed protein product, partial [Nezara viridula]